MAHTSLPKNHILNEATQDAINILLGPYLTSDSQTIYQKRHTQDTEDSQGFVTRMAIIAWDFLNVSSIYQNDILKKYYNKFYSTKDIES